MADGNISRIIVWVTDTVMIDRQLEGQTFYFAADAVTGTPIPNAKFDFFGWKQVQIAPNANQWHVDTDRASAMTGDKRRGSSSSPQA